MGNEPTLDSGYLRPALQFVREQGGSPVDVLSRAGLSEEVAHRSDLVISEPKVWHAFERIEEFAGRPDTGWHIGTRLDWEDLGELGTILRQSHSLHDALRTFVRVVNRFSSHARFRLEEDGERVWLRRAGVRGIERGRRAVEQFTVLCLVRVIRLALGPEWRPETIRLQEEPSEPGSALGGEVELVGGAGWTSIPIPRELLARPIERSGLRESEEVERLRARIAERPPGRAPTIEVAARELEVSVRTLQRRLAEDGLTYSRLVDQVRCAMLRPVLADRSVPLKDVARINGHGDPANLVRFVRRTHGLSPGAVRRTWVDPRDPDARR